AWQGSQGGARRWFWKAARKWVLAGMMVGAASLTAPSLRAQKPDLLPRPETVQSPPAGAPLVESPPAGAPLVEPPPPDGTVLPPDMADAAPGGPPPEDGMDDPPPAGDGKDGKDGACKEPKPYWSLLPPVEKFPRPAVFPILRDGPGYYSLSDVLTDHWRKGPPKYPYPRFLVMPFPFFYADWRYLDDPKNEEHDYLDFLKRIHLGNDFLFTTGGE